MFSWRHDIQHNDTQQSQHNDTQQGQHNDTQYNK